MNGDLSLSRALGGLRIANPDEADNGALPDSGSNTHEPSVRIPGTDPTDYDTDAMRTVPKDYGRPGQKEQNSEAGRLNPAISTPLPVLDDPPAGASTRDTSLLDNQRISESTRRGQQPNVSTAYGVPVRESSRTLGNQFPNSPSSGTSREATNQVPSNQSSEDWKDRGAAVGIRREMDSTGRMIVRQIKKGVRDFSFGRILGEGSYSTVYLATDRQTLKEYAIKVLEKRHIIKEKKIKYVNIEKNTLNRLTEHPGIVRLYYTFQDETSLYYVLDLCNGGELLGVLKKTGSFDVDCVRFYGAQILDAIEYMHSRGVIHRDLKPENVLLDDQMHVKITDFGTAKLLGDHQECKETDSTNCGEIQGRPPRDVEDDRRAASFVGTAEYVSPELLTHKSAGKASDLWAFGCIIYQLFAGRPPFKAGSEYLTFQKIVNLEYDFPPGFPIAARDLVERCLVLDPARRLTIEHIKNHEFFDGQQFGKSLWGAKAPRLRPYVPPAHEPNIIQLNGFSYGAGPSNSNASLPRSMPHSQTTTGGANRPARIITELPPPTQLDIEWSPVLTRNNERILKLGDLLVVSSPLPSSVHRKGSDEGHKKLSRFFGGSTTKKRQRLVMVTSSGRIVLAPAGGEEKRAKQELSLLASDSSWKTQRDAKGQLVWFVDTGGFHYTFEETKTSVNNDEERPSAEEWVECLEKARDMALSHSANTQHNDGPFGDISSAVSSPSSTLGSRAQLPDSHTSHDRGARNHLSKSQPNHDDFTPKRNRFSKRQSRTGLGPAF
ncbi:Serine/threonine-protein kinase domain protein [Metarhizium album ARSEF 1941]|uniref:non-specific serine/threonine protein kinase n=1 Tax=Metarhizium album (strain ARSEF 1941) TaxID=1081103 RepID=A0A0B2X0V5_METAS|nr:Serine/threonine-protein kinase domain protein [Metarhizium album ARSEF 1941]KHN99267.1 Serine/threonine-protein kinase domain protein [Metarhizium album ARSEF 1941]